jgi:hypothetical protein
MSTLMEHPWIAAVIASLLGLLWRWRGRRIAGIAATAWAAYLVYEYLMYARVLCSGECNIRVDLLLIHPVLGLLAAAAVIFSLMNDRASKNADGSYH